MVGEKFPLFYDFFQKRIRNNVVYCFFVSILPSLIIIFIPQFALFSAILVATKFQDYGFIGTFLTWSVIALWMVPIQFICQRIVKKRIENYLSLLIDRKPLDMEEAREYIIEIFRNTKADDE